MKFTCIHITLIVCLIVLFGYMLNPLKESFQSRTIPIKPFIWMYWENYPGKTRPAYLDLCLETVKYNCSNNFNIVVLDNKSFSTYLPDLNNKLLGKLTIIQKTDVIRIALLYKYGGIWLDFDTIITRDLTPIMEKLYKWDFVGFGCHAGYNCSNGSPYPANWVMGSIPGSPLMKLVLESQLQLLHTNDTTYFQSNYHALGRNMIWKMIKQLQQKSNWDYYHWDSKCLERDSIGNKLINSRSISNEDIDPKCIPKLLFIPIYNSAPGFPEWFLKLSRDELLQSNMLISKLFRHSLGITGQK